MSQLYPSIDPDGLLEYSVVFTDRSLNHMSAQFQGIMRDISATLKSVYHADAIALIPGGGTYAMEAVARQVAHNKKCLIIRNGWFSYRWTQIIDAAGLTNDVTVMKARQSEDTRTAAFAPAPIAEVTEFIRSQRPEVIFAPHVETAAGMMLTDDYIRAMADAVHEVGGILVIDSIASGAMWLDMAALDIDILISAPQKGWSGTPCAGVVMMNPRAMAVVEASTSTSFACDLKKWWQIMQAYENGGHAYHATMPTDGLHTFWQMMNEAASIGFDELKQRQAQLGASVRQLMQAKGHISVAAEAFAAPGVVVCYTEDDAIQNGKQFIGQGLQTAAGVPLQCDERADYKTFRIGLFGLDKLMNIERTIATLDKVL